MSLSQAQARWPDSDEPEPFPALPIYRDGNSIRVCTSRSADLHASFVGRVMGGGDGGMLVSTGSRLGLSSAQALRAGAQARLL